MPKDYSFFGTQDVKSDETYALVDAKFTQATGYANTLQGEVAKFMADLEARVSTEQPVDLVPAYPDDPTAVDLSAATTRPDDILLDDAPSAGSTLAGIIPLESLPPISIDTIGNFDGVEDLGGVSSLNLTGLPDLPDPITLDDVPDVSLTDIPDFDGDDITFSNPARPEGLGSSALPAPSINEINIPTAPAIVAVSAPQLSDITIPEMPSVNIPVFEGMRPDSTLVEPDLNFTFEEGVFQSDLSGLITKLNNVYDGTDPLILSSDVVDAILSTAVEQIDIEAAKSYDEILKGWALKGYDIPQGAMVGRLDELMAEGDRSKAQVVRDIGTKQSELAIDAMNQALSIGTQYEGVMIGHFNNVQNRALESAKVAIDSAIKLFDAKVTIYNANVEMYKAEADVFRSLIQGNIAIYDAYKAQMEGVKAQVDVQEAQVSVYVAQLSANEIAAKVYESQIRAVVGVAEIERLKIERFKAEVEAFNARVNAKTAEYSGYDSAVRAELAKAQIAETKVRAYTARVNGVVQRNNAEIQKLQAVTERNKGVAMGNTADAEMFRAAVSAVEAANNAEALRVRAEGDRNSAIAQTNTAQADVFRTQAGAVEQQNKAEMLRLQSVTEQNKSIAITNQNRVDIFKGEVSAIAEKNNAEAQKHGAQMDGYTQDVKVALANYEGTLKKYESDINVHSINSQLALEEAKEKVRVSVQNFASQLEAAKTGAQVYAQLAASAMSMIHTTASTSFSGGNRNSTTADRSKSFETFSYSENYDRDTER